MQINRIFLKKLLPDLLFVLLIFVFTIPLILPFLHSGFFPSHDGEWAVVRLSDMFRELRDLQIPARFSGVLNFEYGYPLFNFAYPGPYYLGILFYLLGFGLVGSIKLMFALSVLLSSVFMYFLSKEIWEDKVASLAAAVAYIYFPYRFVDLFVRGSLGESISFVIFPLVLLSLIKIYKNPNSQKFILFGGILYGTLILMHNIMTVLFSVFLLIVVIFFLLEKGKMLIKPFAILTSLGISLSAFFWIPAILEKKYILLSAIPIADRSQFFVSLSQFILPSWGYGVPTDPNTGFTYQLGFPFLIILLMSLVFFIKKLMNKNNFKDFKLRLGFLFLIADIFLILFLFREFGFLWKIPILSEINFPWTMLSIIVFVTSLLIGFISTVKFFRYIVFALVAFGVVYFLPYAKPESYVNRGDGFYLTNEATTTSSKELMPLWVKTFPDKAPSKKVEILTGGGTINNVVVDSKTVSFDVDSPSQTKLRINTIYYPGWKIFDNSSEVNFSYNNNYGVMDATIGKGSHHIIALFSETRLRILSDLISLASVFLVVIFLFKILNVNTFKNGNS